MGGSQWRAAIPNGGTTRFAPSTREAVEDRSGRAVTPKRAFRRVWARCRRRNARSAVSQSSTPRSAPGFPCQGSGASSHAADRAPQPEQVLLAMSRPHAKQVPVEVPGSAPDPRTTDQPNPLSHGQEPNRPYGRDATGTHPDWSQFGRSGAADRLVTSLGHEPGTSAPIPAGTRAGPDSRQVPEGPSSAMTAGGHPAAHTHLSAGSAPDTDRRPTRTGMLSVTRSTPR